MTYQSIPQPELDDTWPDELEYIASMAYGATIWAAYNNWYDTRESGDYMRGMADGICAAVFAVMADIANIPDGHGQEMKDVIRQAVQEGYNSVHSMAPTVGIG